MHILLIHQVFVRPEDPGGTRHYEFARHFVAGGHRVTVLAGSRSYLTGERLTSPRREEIEPGLEVVRCRVIGGRHRGPAWRTVGFLSFALSALWEGLRVAKVDAVWATSPPLFQGWSGWAIARIRRVPWLLEVRDLWPEFAIRVGALRSKLLIWLSQLLERFLYRRADHIVLNSPGFTEHLTDHGANPHRITMIPNGVDMHSFTSVGDGADLRTSNGLRDKFIALYAGAHGLANDLWQVLQAAEAVQDDPRIAFVFVGDGSEKAKLIASARAKGLRNVHFLPPAAKRSIPALMAEADCGIAVLKPIPIFSTTYPNKVFDYMAAGKPVVLAIDGVIRELIEQAEAGIFVKPGDGGALGRAIRRFADHPEFARRAGSNGRRHVAVHFDRPRLAAEMEAVLRSLSGV